MNGQALVGLFGEQPSADLQGCLELSSLGLSHAALGTERQEVGAGQTGEPTELTKEPLGHSHDVFAWAADAEKNRQQLGIVQGPGSRVTQPFAGAFSGREVSHRGVVFDPGFFLQATRFRWDFA